MKKLKFPGIGELIEGHFVTGGFAHRALSTEQSAAQQEIRAAFSTNCVPLGDFVLPFNDRERRDMTATGSDYGGLAIDTEVPKIGIALRSALVLPRLGSRVFTGLRGNVDLPFGRAQISAQWLAENAVGSDDAELLGKLSLSPKRVTAIVPVSKQLLIQGGPQFHTWIQAQLIDGLAVEAERVAIAGIGAASEPTGILNAISGSGTVAGGADGAAPTITNLVDLEYAITGTNDAGRGPLGWLVSPLVRRKLRLTKPWDGAAPIWSLSETDRLLGYPAGVTPAVPDNLIKGVSTTCSAIIFGNFSEHIIAFWGPGIGVSFVSDKADAIAGKVYVVASAYVDCGVRDITAFDVMKDALCAA